MGKQIKGTNKIDVKGLQDLRPGTGIEGYEYGAELSTEGTPLIDPGEGNMVSIRTFTFKMHPDRQRLGFPDNKQEIFNQHARQIQHVLWGDGLEPYTDTNPRVIIDRSKGIYQILIACIAKKGVLFSSMNKPVNLSEQLAKESKRKLDKPKS